MFLSVIPDYRAHLRGAILVTIAFGEHLLHDDDVTILYLMQS